MAALLLVFSPLTAFGAQVLPQGFLIGDENGIHVQADGTFLIAAYDMEPGDAIYKTLTIQNTENSTFDLTMTAQPLTQTGPIELLNSINCRLTLNGQEIYNGRLYGDDGVNMITNALALGTYGPGDIKVMHIELNLDETIPTELLKEKSVAEIRWNFYAIKKADATPPFTGILEENNMLALSLFLLVGSALLLALKSKRIKG